jgi:hypothetical protein
MLSSFGAIGNKAQNGLSAVRRMAIWKRESRFTFRVVREIGIGTAVARRPRIAGDRSSVNPDQLQMMQVTCKTASATFSYG